MDDWVLSVVLGGELGRTPGYDLLGHISIGKDLNKQSILKTERESCPSSGLVVIKRNSLPRLS